MHTIIAFVGMTGSGKSTAAEGLIERGWTFIRFGQVTIDKLKEAGLEINPDNEKTVREGLRKDYGMGAFATLSLPAVKEGTLTGSVVIDGLYSWSEYKILKDAFGDTLYVIAVYASPKTRYARLEKRLNDAANDPDFRNRPLTAEQAHKRDHAEIENIEKGGPIVMADFTVVNESTAESLTTQVLTYVDQING